MAEEVTYYYSSQHPKVDRETFQRLREESMSNKKIFDMGRESNMRVETTIVPIKYGRVGIDPVREGGEVIIPLTNIDITNVEVPKPNFTFECEFDAISAESFKKAWENIDRHFAVQPTILEGGMKIKKREFKSDFRPIDENGDFIDPKPITPYGKNLYSRKLRIRR